MFVNASNGEAAASEFKTKSYTKPGKSTLRLLQLDYQVREPIHLVARFKTIQPSESVHERFTQGLPHSTTADKELLVIAEFAQQLTAGDYAIIDKDSGKESALDLPKRQFNWKEFTKREKKRKASSLSPTNVRVVQKQNAPTLTYSQTTGVFCINSRAHSEQLLTEKFYREYIDAKLNKQIQDQQERIEALENQVKSLASDIRPAGKEQQPKIPMGQLWKGVQGKPRNLHALEAPVWER